MIDTKEQNFIIYSTGDNKVNIQILADKENETIWLNQKQIADIFEVDRTSITKHIKNIFKDGELKEISVSAKISHTADDGKKYFVVVIPKFNVVLSADTSLTFIKEADAFFQEHKEKLLAEHKAAIAAEQAALESAVPGISVLRQAYEADDSYHDDFRRAMESEQRDGARMPKRPAEDIPALEAQYPRAVLYLRAEAYSDASHHLKAAAGKKAMQLLRDGGNEADAEAILQNWLPAESIWD